MPSMADNAFPQIRAGIDIGTNTALMVVAHLHADGTYDVVADVHELPRLGEGLATTGQISSEAISRALHAMEHFRDVLAPYPDVLVRVVATSAMREATNGREVAAMLAAVVGHPIDIIDGAEEARLTFLGSVGTTPQPTVMIDIGGGSTEYAVGVNGAVTYATSIPIGAVKFTEQYAVTRPIPAEALADAAATVVAALASHREHLAMAQHGIGVAGTPVALAMLDKGLMAYDHTELHGHVMSIDRITELSNMLCTCSLLELRAIPGLHERRADIVPMGSVILRASLHALGMHTIEARTTGLRYGAMMTA